ncbi:MAG: ribbon-helix-helix domain-containing protein [Anaerolineae bacterium]
MDRVMVTMPDSLRRELDQEATAVAESRSEFMRRAVQERIERLRRQRFEQRLAEGYQWANDDPASVVSMALRIQDASVGPGWRWDG